MVRWLSPRSSLTIQPLTCRGHASLGRLLWHLHPVVLTTVCRGAVPAAWPPSCYWRDVAGLHSDLEFPFWFSPPPWVCEGWLLTGLWGLVVCASLLISCVVGKCIPFRNVDCPAPAEGRGIQRRASRYNKRLKVAW